jgi:hypothetical protein
MTGKICYANGSWRETGKITGGAVPICSPGKTVEPQVGDVIACGLCDNGWQVDIGERGFVAWITYAAMDSRWNFATLAIDDLNHATGECQ